MTDSQYRGGVDAVRSVLRNNKKVKCLYSRESLDVRSHADLMERVQLGAQIRITDSSLCNIIILDRRTAVVWDLGRDRTDYSASVLHAPGLVRPLVRLATTVWAGAADLQTISSETVHDLAEHRSSQVLSALAAGDTDEVAARKLGISVRTYRRYVAVVLEKVGATSRFQAGVRVASLGRQYGSARREDPSVFDEVAPTP